MAPKNLILFVNGNDCIFLRNVKTHHTKSHPISHKYGSLKFFEQFSSIANLTRVKAIIFTLYGKEFSSFTQEYAFRQKCRQFCEERGIFYYFPIMGLRLSAAALLGTKTMVQLGETVLILHAESGNDLTGYFMMLREQNCYKIARFCYSRFLPFSQEWKNDIFGEFNPKNIIRIYKDSEDKAYSLKLKNFFKDQNFAVFNAGEKAIFEPFEKVLHLLGEKINPFDVRDNCKILCEVRIGFKILFSNTMFDVAPFEKSAIVDVNPAESVSLSSTFPSVNYYLPQGFELVKEVKLSEFKSKKVKITLKIDMNSFYDFQVEPYDERSTDEVLSQINLAADEPSAALEKARMIFDKQNFSVYGFAGLTKTPIYISFHEAKPVVGKAAMEMYANKPKFVVFDLIKLCSVTADDICNPKWGFKLSKEDETLIVTMQTLEDERKSTVAFLLALIIKNGNSRIKNEYGKKMTELEIGFDGYQPNETLKKNFVEAGELLKIGIVFV